MDWNSYQQQALTTAIFPLDRSLEYTTLGLASESGELGEAYLRGKISIHGVTVEQVLSELGDVCWYAAAVADAIECPFADIRDDTSLNALPHYGRGFTILMIQSHVSNIAGIVKKTIRDNEGFVELKHMQGIQNELMGMMYHVERLALAYDSNLNAVMSKNLNKLADRKQRGVLAGSGDNR